MHPYRARGKAQGAQGGRAKLGATGGNYHSIRDNIPANGF